MRRAIFFFLQIYAFAFAGYFVLGIIINCISYLMKGEMLSGVDWLWLAQHVVVGALKAGLILAAPALVVFVSYQIIEFRRGRH